MNDFALMINEIQMKMFEEYKFERYNKTLIDWILRKITIPYNIELNLNSLLSSYYVKYKFCYW